MFEGTKIKQGKTRNNRVEIILAGIICIFALVILVNQYVLADATHGIIARVGVREDDSAGSGGSEQVPEHIITLQLKNFSALPHMRVLVNREIKGNFTDRYVTIPVNSGDLIEVDGTFYNHDIHIELINSSDQINFPAEGTRFTVKGNVTVLGTVQIKDRT